MIKAKTGFFPCQIAKWRKEVLQKYLILWILYLLFWFYFKALGIIFCLKISSTLEYKNSRDAVCLFDWETQVLNEDLKKKNKKYNILFYVKEIFLVHCYLERIWSYELSINVISPFKKFYLFKFFLILYLPNFLDF